MKRTWAKATVSAVFRLSETNALRTPVNVVPIFAPIVKANIFSILTNPMPQRGVRVDVVTLLDWNRMVMLRMYWKHC